jgi:exodeoxyribonuclease V gamma subunit
LLDLLALSPVRERFDLSVSDVELIKGWVVDCNIRWGFDANHRASHGLSQDEQNTWAFGLQRLLLGYALNTTDDTWRGVLPYTEIEGSAALVLGNFCHFVRTLQEQLVALWRPRPLTEWQTLLSQLTAELLCADASNHWQHEQILSALAEVVEAASVVQHSEPLQLGVVRELLSAHFDQGRAARGFLSGGVTFCAMVPMRSVPFRVIALLGMNDGAFPRVSHRADFSLMGASGRGRKLGDPDRRADDRYLFLEALLSARERLLITFIGQSVRDNALVPPSIVVTELLSYLVAQYPPKDEPGGHSQEERVERARAQFVTRHPLQPFSPRYFNGQEPKLFSYEQAFLHGAKLLGPERSVSMPLFNAPLSPVQLGQELPFSELLAFFRSPAGYLMRRRLNIELETRDVEVSDREPLHLDGLESYTVGALALDYRLRGLSNERIFELLSARGDLPCGNAGKYEHERVMHSVDEIAELLFEIRQGDPLPNASFAIAIEVIALDSITASTKLCGSLNQVWPSGNVFHQYSRVAGRHLLQAWLHHLVLCALQPAGASTDTWLVGRDAGTAGADEPERMVAYRFEPVVEPLTELHRLVRLFAVGQTEPLLLFPDASRAYQQAKRAGSAPEWPLSMANRVLKNEVKYDRVLQRLYGLNPELDERGFANAEQPQGYTFAEVTHLVFDSLLEHLTQEC